MSETTQRTTPTGLQSTTELQVRRILVTVLNVGTWIAFNLLCWRVLGAEGWSVIDIALALCIALGSPWAILGFWNAVIGLWMLHGASDALHQVAPYLPAGDSETTPTIRTAILMTLRNEDPARAIARMKIVKNSVDAAGMGDLFDYFLLSDTNRPEIALHEEALAQAFADEAGTGRVIYRRRTENTGFKAGNLRDFCERWGARYELMLPLDADSLMSGPTIARLVRIMEAHPRLGILQTLVVGMTSRSLFARLFQFGMRQSMRSYTMGQAWWVGDCGPFWGHNAMVRIRPFFDHCDLPILPGEPPLGGHILSHDQVEATLMRRAGFEVRVLPIECGSWEENPPTLPEFTRRDSRWCQGNMQYLKLLDLPGLQPVSRFQMVWAILMFIGVPAWFLALALVALKPFDGEATHALPDFAAIVAYLAFLIMFQAPKLAGIADVLLSPAEWPRYGGKANFLRSCAVEMAFSFLLLPITTLRITVFMAGLALGKSVQWGGQQRDAQALTWQEAARELWPQTLAGLVIWGLLLAFQPCAFWWSLPVSAGLTLAIPFAVWTASPQAGERALASHLAAVPEEFDLPDEVRQAHG